MKNITLYLLIIAIFAGVFGTTYAIWTAWQVPNYSGQNWVKNPDATAATRGFSTATTINGVSAYKDNFTNLYWEANPSTTTFKWATDTSYGEPTWNGSNNYTGANWSTTNYPAFARCTGLGTGWRLPTIRELYTLVSYTLKNANNAYTAHPALDNTSYWSSTQRASSTTNAWRVGFTNGITYYGTKTSSSRVVCVHD